MNETSEIEVTQWKRKNRLLNPIFIVCWLVILNLSFVTFSIWKMCHEVCYKYFENGVKNPPRRVKNIGWNKLKRLR